jgi:Ran GTPase-activating protein (RanGAP) involved in mRNA processing and transport
MDEDDFIPPPPPPDDYDIPPPPPPEDDIYDLPPPPVAFIPPPPVIFAPNKPLGPPPITSAPPPPLPVSAPPPPVAGTPLKLPVIPVGITSPSQVKGTIRGSTNLERQYSVAASGLPLPPPPMNGLPPPPPVNDLYSISNEILPLPAAPATLPLIRTTTFNDSPPPSIPPGSSSFMGLGKEGNLLLTIYKPDGNYKKVSVSRDMKGLELLAYYAEKIELQNYRLFALAIGTADENTGLWIDPNLTLEQQNIKNMDNLTVKMKYVKRLKGKKENAALQIIYTQVRQAILKGELLTTESEAVRLASYELQIEFGDHNPKKHKPGAIDQHVGGIERYIPQRIVNNFTSKYWQRRMYKLHKNYMGMSHEAAILEYIQIAGKLPTFGAVFFIVVTVSGPAKLAVVEDGILVLKNQESVLDYHPFRQISRWRRRQDGFEIFVINETDKLEDSLVFTVDKAKADSILELITGYVILIGDTKHTSIDSNFNRDTLPPTDLIEAKPEPRILTDLHVTRLDHFKASYEKSSRGAGVTPLAALVRQLNEALDKQIPLESLALTTNILSAQDFSHIVLALCSSLRYRPSQNRVFGENLQLKYLDLSSNDIFPDSFDILGNLLRELKDPISLRLADIKLTKNGGQQLSQLLEKSHGDFSELILVNTEINKGVGFILRNFEGQKGKYLVKLDLTNCGLESSTCGPVAQLLESHDTAITYLNLSNNKIEKEGVKVVIQSLYKNKTLTHLDFANNKFPEKSAIEIAALFEKPTAALKSLCIARNTLSTKVAQKFSELLSQPTSLTYLDMYETHIGKQGCQMIVKALQTNNTLTHLNIGKNDFDSKSAVALSTSMGSNMYLSTLLLRNSGIGKSGMTALTQAIKTNRYIQTLDLSFSGLGTEGARMISDALVFNNTLMELYFSVNEIGSEGAKYFSDVLKNNRTINMLQLNANKIGDKGARELAHGLQMNNTIRTLTLQENGISKSSVGEILNALENNSVIEILDLSRNSVERTSVADKLENVSPYINIAF